MIKLPRLSSQIIKDYFFTFFTYGVTFLCTLFVYFYISHYYEHVEFEKYNLSRRVMSVIYVLLMLGLAVSLPRTVALMPHNYFYKLKVSANLIVSVILIASITILFSAIVILFPNFFGMLFWDTTKYSYLLITISVCLISMGIFAVVFSFSRGLMCIKYANLMTLLSTVIPIFSMFFIKHIETFYWVTTISNLLISAIFILLLYKKYELITFFAVDYLLKQGKMLLKFGIPRIPGDFALEGLLSIPVFITAHINGITSASSLGFAASLISMVGTFLSPVNLVLLPYSASMIAKKDMNGLRGHLNTLFKLFIPLIIVGIVVLNLMAEYIVKTYLNKENLEVENYIRIISLAFIPYIIYLIVRSVNDTVYFRPVNAINAVIALIILVSVTGIVYYFNWYYKPALIGLVVGIYSLGLLSFISYNRIFKR